MAVQQLWLFSTLGPLAADSLLHLAPQSCGAFCAVSSKQLRKKLPKDFP